MKPRCERCGKLLGYFLIYKRCDACLALETAMLRQRQGKR
jgi:hypothetical protein